MPATTVTQSTAATGNSTTAQNAGRVKVRYVELKPVPWFQELFDWNRPSEQEAPKPPKPVDPRQSKHFSPPDFVVNGDGKRTPVAAVKYHRRIPHATRIDLGSTRTTQTADGQVQVIRGKGKRSKTTCLHSANEHIPEIVTDGNSNAWKDFKNNQRSSTTTQRQQQQQQQQQRRSGAPPSTSRPQNLAKAGVPSNSGRRDANPQLSTPVTPRGSNATKITQQKRDVIQPKKVLPSTPSSSSPGTGRRIPSGQQTKPVAAKGSRAGQAIQQKSTGNQPRTGSSSSSSSSRSPLSLSSTPASSPRSSPPLKRGVPAVPGENPPRRTRIIFGARLPEEEEEEEEELKSLPSKGPSPPPKAAPARQQQRQPRSKASSASPRRDNDADFSAPCKTKPQILPWTKDRKQSPGRPGSAGLSKKRKADDGEGEEEQDDDERVKSCISVKKPKTTTGSGCASSSSSSSSSSSPAAAAAAAVAKKPKGKNSHLSNFYDRKGQRLEQCPFIMRC